MAGDDSDVVWERSAEDVVSDDDTVESFRDDESSGLLQAATDAAKAIAAVIKLIVFL